MTPLCAFNCANTRVVAPMIMQAPEGNNQACLERARAKRPCIDLIRRRRRPSHATQGGEARPRDWCLAAAPAPRGLRSETESGFPQPDHGSLDTTWERCGQQGGRRSCQPQVSLPGMLTARAQTLARPGGSRTNDVRQQEAVASHDHGRRHS